MLLTLLTPDPISPGPGLLSDYRARGGVGANGWVYKYQETVIPLAGQYAVYVGRGGQSVQTWIPGGFTVAPVQLSFDYRGRGGFASTAWSNSFVSTAAANGSAIITGAQAAGAAGGFAGAGSGSAQLVGSGATGSSGTISGFVGSLTATTQSYRQRGSMDVTTWMGDGLFSGSTVPGVANIVGASATGYAGGFSGSVPLVTATTHSYRQRGSMDVTTWMGDGNFAISAGNAVIAGASASGSAGAFSASGNAVTATIYSYRQRGSLDATAWMGDGNFNYISGIASVTGSSAAGAAGGFTATGAGQAFIMGSGASGQAGQYFTPDFSFTLLNYDYRGRGAVSVKPWSNQLTIPIPGVAQITGSAATSAAGQYTGIGVGYADITGASATGSSGYFLPVGSVAGTATIYGAGAVGHAGTFRGDGNQVYVISSARAKLIYELALLHGLDYDNPLTVAPSRRSAGQLSQTIAGDASVMISTDTEAIFSGDLDTWIDALAAIHGLTTSLVVTADSRTSGAIFQSIATTGGVTTVTRM